MRFAALATISLLLLTTPCFAISPPSDKIDHAVVGYIVANEIAEHSKLDYWQRITFLFSLGLVKEIVDVAYNGQFDGLDIVAGCVGASIKF